MRSLDKILNEFNNTEDASVLPDIATEYYLIVNSQQDGWRSLYRGGHAYVIKQDGSNYAIYKAHSSKYNATLIGSHSDPKQVDGFYLDDVPKVQIIDNVVCFEERDSRSGFDIVPKLGTLPVKDSDNLLYDVLQAFYVYANSVYRFSDSYDNSLVPPIVVAKPDDTLVLEDDTSNSAGSNSSNGSNGSASQTSQPSSAGSDGSQSSQGSEGTATGQESTANNSDASK